MPDDMLKRNVNVGFSGGEKKRNEVLQMAILRPQLAILDETDSGLDIDALKIVADGVNALRGPEFSALVITHYQRLLDHIVPDRVHVLAGGRIVRSGGPELAHGTGGERLRRRDRGGRMNALASQRRCGAAATLSSRATRACADGCPATRARATRRRGVPPARPARVARDEAWHYTNLRAARRSPFRRAADAGRRLRGAAGAAADARRAAAGVRRRPVPRRSVDRCPRVASRVLPARRPSARSRGPSASRMVALNTMLAEDGAAIEVPAGVDGGAAAAGQPRHRRGGRPVAFHPRHRIRLGARRAR